MNTNQSLIVLFLGTFQTTENQMKKGSTLALIEQCCSVPTARQKVLAVRGVGTGTRTWFEWLSRLNPWRAGRNIRDAIVGDMMPRVTQGLVHAQNLPDPQKDALYLVGMSRGGFEAQIAARVLNESPPLTNRRDFQLAVRQFCKRAHREPTVVRPDTTAVGNAASDCLENPVAASICCEENGLKPTGKTNAGDSLPGGGSSSPSARGSRQNLDLSTLRAGEPSRNNVESESNGRTSTGSSSNRVRGLFAMEPVGTRGGEAFASRKAGARPSTYFHGYAVDELPPNVVHARVILTAGEDRTFMQPITYNLWEKTQNLHQMWFQGVHGDTIGISILGLMILAYLCVQMKEAGIVFNDELLAQRVGSVYGGRVPYSVCIPRVLGRLLDSTGYRQPRTLHPKHHQIHYTYDEVPDNAGFKKHTCTVQGRWDAEKDREKEILRGWNVPLPSGY